MNLSLSGLRVLREVADAGSFSAAALSLQYSQSAVSRQVAVLERDTGQRLFERSSTGVRLTPAGDSLVSHAKIILDELDRASRDLAQTYSVGEHVRLGVFISAGAVLVPRALALVRTDAPQITVATREGTTPALIRALRAGTLDLAVLTSRPPFHPPDGEQPSLELTTLQDLTLLVAVSITSPLAQHDELHPLDLLAEPWIATRSRADEPLLGVWPTLGVRHRVVHWAGDWTTKMALVAAGCGITTVPGNLLGPLPEGVRALPVRMEPTQRRRVLVAVAPGRPSDAVSRVIAALQSAGAGMQRLQGGS